MSGTQPWPSRAEPSRAESSRAEATQAEDGNEKEVAANKGKTDKRGAKRRQGTGTRKRLQRTKERQIKGGGKRRQGSLRSIGMATIRIARINAPPIRKGPHASCQNLRYRSVRLPPRGDFVATGRMALRILTSERFCGNSSVATKHRILTRESKPPT